MLNYRCPDVAVFLHGGTAVNRGTHWFGGPDFAVEIVSEDDATHDKLDFDASVGVRELLIIERDPWALEVFRLQDGRLQVAGRATVDDRAVLTSGVVPLAFHLIAGEPRPRLVVDRIGSNQAWTV
jgi:hypothetical protein